MSACHVAEGKSALRPFGEPPSAGKQNSLDDPGKAADGKPAAKAAMDGVTNDAVGEKLGKQTGAELGSGNSPLGK